MGCQRDVNQTSTSVNIPLTGETRRTTNPSVSLGKKARRPPGGEIRRAPRRLIRNNSTQPGQRPPCKNPSSFAAAAGDAAAPRETWLARQKPAMGEREPPIASPGPKLALRTMLILSTIALLRRRKMGRIVILYHIFISNCCEAAVRRTSQYMGFLSVYGAFRRRAGPKASAVLSAPPGLPPLIARLAW